MDPLASMAPEAAADDAATDASARESARPVGAALAAAESPRPRVAACTLADRSAYQGEVDATGAPHGAGVQSASGGATYAGEFRGGRKHGVGVLALANGAVYAGDFVANEPSGFGVHMSPFADKFIGEWRNGAREGVGMSVDANAAISFGRFVEGELVADERAAYGEMLEGMQLALVAERRAMQSQEIARDRQLQAALEELSSVDAVHFQDVEQIAEFEARRQRELEQFVAEQNAAVAEIERAADAFKFREAELKQRQKQLRAEIDARAAELSIVAHYCALASERKAQADEAERTLHMLQRQLGRLQDDSECGPFGDPAAGMES